MSAFIKQFQVEMQRGLDSKQSSLQMLPTFVDRPSGQEKGDFLTVDLGGTNLRISLVTLNGESRVRTRATSRFKISSTARAGDMDSFFDFIAVSVRDFLLKNNLDQNRNYDLGFTFSFPVDQSAIDSGKLVKWTKGFEFERGEGEDVVKLLQAALKRQQITCVRVNALLNDTVATILDASYSEPDCDMGVILGTGTNACYPEKSHKIKKLPRTYSPSNMIVNMEWGNFNKLNRTPYDDDLDKASSNPGQQRMEKMVSGLYLSEIASRIIRHMIDKKLLFNDANDFDFFKNPTGFKTENMEMIAADKSDSLELTKQFLSNRGIRKTTVNDRAMLQQVCHLVSRRAARIITSAIMAVVLWLDPPLKNRHVVAIDGSLFEKFLGFQHEMEAVLQEHLGSDCEKIELTLAKEGSGKGAAIAAAISKTKN